MISQEQNEKPTPDDDSGDSPAETVSGETVSGETVSADAAPASAEPDAPTADDSPDNAPDDVAALAAEAADLRDRLLRAVAETENLRRRADRERDDLRKYAIADFARDLLGVADNMRRALDSVPETAREGNPELASLLEGVELTERELQNMLEKHGIKPVDPMGEKFDPNLHQAMAQIEDDTTAPGTVVNVMQIGYTVHDRLLRAAMVAVAKAKTAARGDDTGAGNNVDTQA